ncbi:ACP phosphodiesterase [Clostridiaceae bacterium]|nr:ACP phosphodiesterase [Clostridiaceae bacterium]RKI18370.1 ACP phosphodiesterase [bacterium 1XD21-70]
MGLLFINACYREGSRTRRLAEHFVNQYQGDVKEICIGDLEVCALDRKHLEIYNKAVREHTFTDPMFGYAKEFGEADEILIAAPFWNYSIPAALHAYLELVCTQGITFDIQADGQYVSMCRGKKLTYVTTAGGYIPEEDHGFGYIKSLAEIFWNIQDVRYYKAEGLDIVGADVEGALRQALKTSGTDIISGAAETTAGV